MKYLRWLLFPFSLIYGLAVIVRNWCYDSGVFKSVRFTKPVISVGNLDVGGAGKSPMTEYLIRLLKDDYKIATLSRGYGRETKGYVVANQESRVKNQKNVNHNSPLVTQHSPLAAQIGDEPAQFKQKFPDVTVAVCEKRVEGIKKLLPDHDLVLLDDAYQHRAVEPGLSILLFDYSRLNEPHLLLPAGNMREPFSGRWRAQVLIISKCPQQLNVDEQNVLVEKIQPLPYQKVFFTAIAYQALESLNGTRTDVVIDNHTTIFLLTGIANPKPLVIHLSNITPNIIHHNYPDHHQFTLKNIAKLAAEYGDCKSSNKIIITTEKDAQRLDGLWFKTDQPLTYIPVFVLPIRAEFLNGSAESFDQLILQYVREHTAYNGVH